MMSITHGWADWQAAPKGYETGDQPGSVAYREVLCFVIVPLLVYHTMEART
jgi:hypothetical protein